MKKNNENRIVKRRSMAGEVLSRLVRNKTAMLGLAILLIVVFACMFANVICPQGYNANDLPNRYQSPSWQHPFGTDNFGRSMLARVLYGGRNSLTIGFLATCLAAIICVIFGAVSGYFGGKTDMIVMRFMDVLNAIPNLLLAIVISACLGTGKVNTVLAVGISFIPGFAKQIRGPVIALMNSDYIEAARSIDASNARIIAKHVLPNVLSPLIVQFTLTIALSILCVSSLSFLGLGIQPPEPEWGALLSAGRSFLTHYPYLCTFPGLGIALTVFSVNLFGDGLRDAIDPKLKN